MLFLCLEVLKYKALYGVKVVFSPNEMKLLKDLNSVKDYKLIIKFLNHKLISKNMETDLLYDYKYIKKNNENAKCKNVIG